MAGGRVPSARRQSARGSPASTATRCCVLPVQSDAPIWSRLATERASPAQRVQRTSQSRLRQRASQSRRNRTRSPCTSTDRRSPPKCMFTTTAPIRQPAGQLPASSRQPMRSVLSGDAERLDRAISRALAEHFAGRTAPRAERDLTGLAREVRQEFVEAQRWARR